jgi:hypothetical protein
MDQWNVMGLSLNFWLIQLSGSSTAGYHSFYCMWINSLHATMYIKLLMIIYASHMTISYTEKYVNQTLSYLKIVSKRPVSQHFKECVMVNILSNIIQIIMLATSSNTFLGVNSSYPLGHITTGVNSTQENGLKLHQKNNKINTCFCDTSKIFLPIKPSLPQ